MGRLILLIILMIIAFFLGFFIAKYSKSNGKKEKQTNATPKLSDLKGKKFKEYINNLTKHLH